MCPSGFSSLMGSERFRKGVIEGESRSNTLNSDIASHNSFAG